MDISSRIAKILIDKDNTNMGRYWGRGEGGGEVWHATPIQYND